jgi:hypothetical protein
MAGVEEYLAFRRKLGSDRSKLDYSIDEYCELLDRSIGVAESFGLPTDQLKRQRTLYSSIKGGYHAKTVAGALVLIENGRIDDGDIGRWTQAGLFEDNREFEALAKGGYWDSLPTREQVVEAKAELFLTLVRRVLDNLNDEGYGSGMD